MSVDFVPARAARPVDLPNLIAEQAEKSPSAPAIVGPEQFLLTYADLRCQVNAVTETLNSIGIGRGDRVATILSNGPEAAFATVAISSAATWAPINPSYSIVELERYLAHLNPKALLLSSQSSTPARQVARALGIPVLELCYLKNTRSFEITGKLAADAVHRGPAHSEDTALVLYTSGTSGQQKLVTLTHNNICFSAHSISEALELVESDRCLSVMPLFHIHGLSAVFASMAAGGSIVCTADFSPSRFLKNLEEFRPTWYTAAPAIHQAILESAKAESKFRAARAFLRFIRSASSPMPPQLMSDLECGFGVPVIEAYGMTEAGPQIATNRLPPSERRRGSVGRAAGPEICIMDETGHRKTPKEIGEVVVRGPNVTNVFDGNGSFFHDGWLRTGDLGYLDPDGYLFITGRLKEIVNRGGEKISPREVDEALMEHPAILEAVSFAVPHRTLGESVGAAVVLREHKNVTAAEIRKFAATRLAHFKVPGHIAIVAEIPKGSGGKVQRIGMAELLGLQDESGEEAPRTWIEERIVQIFADVLGLEQIGIHDNFFHRGGHSLMATQVVSRLLREFDLSLPMEILFDHPTASELADLVSTRLSDKSTAPEHTSFSIPRRNPLDPCPLSFAQQRLWFLDQVEPGNPAYNMHAALRVEGLLDIEVLAQSLTEIVRRHEALRTTCHATGEIPAQRISPPAPLRLAVTDLSRIPESQRWKELLRLDAAEASHPFHLKRGPLFRAAVARLDVQDHVLFLTMHHLVSDGWSMGVLYRELETLYSSLTTGDSAHLPELPIQYSDYAIWQRQHLEGAGLKKDLEYWKTQLSDCPPSLSLPLDRTRPSVQSYQGARLRRTVSVQVLEDLKAVSQQEESTVFMVLLAAFQTLLLRYTGQQDIVVGTPIAHRTRVETEKLIGFFANTLAMRTDLSGNPTFREALHRVRAMAREAFAHQDVPFEKVVEELRPDRNSMQTPLFQVMFAFQNAPSSSPGLGPGLAVRPLELDTEVAKFDLTLYFTETTEGLTGTWQYSRDLFEPDTIQRMARHFEILLNGIAQNPDQHLSELPLLTEVERQELLVGKNPPAAAHTDGTCFYDLFEEQVKRAPNAPAVQCGNVRLTYSELSHRADQLAHHLQSLGIQPGTLVGVCLTRSAGAAIALLGVLKAGCAYVPMDPNDPAERLSFILEDSRVPVLITEEVLSEKLPSSQTATVLLETELKHIPDGRESTFAVPSSQSLAYVIYTSGSTGKPKGVMITHANLVQYVCSLRDALGIATDDRWLHAASFGFSSSIRQFLVPLSCGATVVVATVEEIQDPWAMFESIRRDRVSIIDLVPSHLRVCAHALTQGNASTAQHQNSLRLILSASETLASDIPRALARLLGNNTKMVNMFGQTETTGIVTVYPITARDENTMKNVPIGSPIASSRVYVLDAFRRPVPMGVPGELYVGGNGVGAGYLNQPALTAERFVPDPFSNGVTSRLYRTGDLARYLSDGNLEFLGRTDHQLKVRGFRVEPGEIEAVLGQHPLVRECAVVAVNDENGHHLVAHVVATQTSSTLMGELRQYLRTKLAHYMIPAVFVELEKLPRTSHGKVDRRALSAESSWSATTRHPVEKIWAVASEKDPEQVEIQAGFVSPRTPAEKTLAGIWANVLGVERISIHDNFFDLGGDSLLTTHVVQRARNAGLPLRIAEVFKHQTIAQLAQASSLKTEPTVEPGPEWTAAVRVAPKPAFRVTAESLRAYGREALEKSGLSPEGAAIVTEVQLEASLRSQPTHNIGSIPRYARRIGSGRTNPQPIFRIERETPVSALVDGDNGQGQWVAVWAMQLAIRKAKESGIGLVGAKRSNHFGAAGHYAWLAAKENLIGLCTSNAGVWLAPTGGLTPTFGNNPLAVGIPARRSLPILMDISMGVAAKGKIGLHLAEGNPLPLGWIFDRFGRLSIDPSDLAAGLGVPMGGHKGYGLTVVLETLTGILTGAGFCGDHRRERMRQGPPDLGQLFVVINPELFMPIDEFTTRVDSMVDQVKSGERAENVPEILLPGETEMRAREENLLRGVPVLPVTHAALEKYRKSAGLGCGLEFVAK